MYIYSCKHDWESILSCIYTAWTSGHGHENIELVFEPINQLSLFDEYIHVENDSATAQKVITAIKSKLSYSFFYQLAFTSMAYEADVMNVIYRVMILGFHLKTPEVLNMVQYRDVMRFRDIQSRVSKEVNLFQEVLRFNQINESLYISHIEPKSRIAIALGPIFADRMPSEDFIIIDDTHKEAVIHQKDKECYIRQLSDNEYIHLKDTEKINDSFTDLWKLFFNTIAIKERENPVCQRNHFKIWARKHAVEFN